MKRLAAVALTVLAGTVPAGTVPLAYASFRDGASATSTFSAAQLAAPTGLSLSRTCSLLNGLLGGSFSLTWTPSGTAWATGQHVELRSSAGVLVGSADLGPAASSTSFSVVPALSPTYTATVTSTYATWTSAAATASRSGC